MAQINTPEHFYSIVLANLPVGYSRVNPEGLIVEFNEAAEKITGYSKNEVLGRPHLGLLHGSAATACPLFDSLTEQKERIATEAAIVTKSGEIIRITVTSFPLFDENGVFLGGVEIFRDITEFKRLERERGNLLSMFVHDMKSPMATALGFLQRILARKYGSLTETQENHLQRIRASLEMVDRLVRDFLDFSRYGTKEFKPQLGFLDIVALLKEQIEEIRIRGEQKNISLFYDGPPRLLVEADSAMLARVVINLLDNAIRYTAPNGSVGIRVYDQDQEILMHVEDTGSGIPQDRLPFIFDAFYRASRDTKGSGLGLAVVRSVVEAHHGRIMVTSALGRGTTFSITLPKKQPGKK